MKLKLFFISALIALFVTAACTDAAKPPMLGGNPVAETTVVNNNPQDEAHDAPRISLADAKKAYDAGAMFIDVRDATAYKTEHVKGALHIPISEVAANEDKLPKGKKIIVYCSWREEHTSASWVAAMRKKGYDAVALLGGTQAWKDAGYPMEKNQ